MMKIYKRHVKNRGFSLLEVLVSMLLLALGFLAMVGLQANSMQYSKMAYYRGIASQIGSGLASSIRANRDGIADYAYEEAYNPNATVPPQQCMGSSSCTARTIANDDVAWARLSAKAQLPGGNVYVSPNVAADAVDVILMWQDPDNKGELQLACPSEIVVGAHKNVQCLKVRAVL